jgi:hypothetical protein
MKLTCASNQDALGGLFRGVRKNCTQYPDGVHFCEQIGVTEDEFKDALGRKWLTSVSFSTLKSRKVGYARFATVDLIYSDYGSETESPADSSLIVSGAASSAAAGRGPSLGRLLRSIEKLAPNSGARTRQKDDSST